MPLTIAFLIDTSEGMGEPASGVPESPTFLDRAVNAALALISSFNSSQIEVEYLLSTYAEPSCVSRILPEREGQIEFLLRSLRAQDTSSPATALTRLFVRLSILRARASADTFGEGRWPDRSHATHIVWIHRADEVLLKKEKPFELPGLKAPGAEFYREPFRWDQTLYAVTLYHPRSVAFGGGYRAIAENTGGYGTTAKTPVELEWEITKIINTINGTKPRSFSIHLEDVPVSAKAAIQAPDHLVSIHRLPDPTDGRVDTFWPFPEAYWVDSSTLTLLPRYAQLILHYVRDAQTVHLPQGYPVDTYQLPSSIHLARDLLASPIGTSWPIFVNNSWREQGLGGAIGVVLHQGNGTVALCLYGYDYPTILSYVKDIQERPALLKDPEWAARLGHYLGGVPAYYQRPIHHVLSLYLPPGAHFPRTVPIPTSFSSPAAEREARRIYEAARALERQVPEHRLSENPVVVPREALITQFTLARAQLLERAGLKETRIIWPSGSTEPLATHGFSQVIPVVVASLDMGRESHVERVASSPATSTIPPLTSPLTSVLFRSSEMLDETARETPHETPKAISVDSSPHETPPIRSVESTPIVTSSTEDIVFSEDGASMSGAHREDVAMGDVPMDMSLEEGMPEELSSLSMREEIPIVVDESPATPSTMPAVFMGDTLTPGPRTPSIVDEAAIELPVTSSPTPLPAKPNVAVPSSQCRVDLVKYIRLPPKQYDEDEIMGRLQVIAREGYKASEKRMIFRACIAAAKATKRKALLEYLEQLLGHVV